MSQNNQKRFLLVYIEPTPYILSLINSIISVSVNEIDVLFLRENSSQNWNIKIDKKWKILPKQYRNRISLIRQLIFKSRYDLFHIAGWGDPWALLFILLIKLIGKPLTIESDTPIPYDIKLWKRMIKRLFYPHLFGFVNIFLPGGIRQAQYLKHYGVKTEKIIPANMTVDVENIQRHVKILSCSDRRRIRESHGIPEKSIVFLFVGRLMQHKGINDLIAVFSKINFQQATLLFVGDGPMRLDVEQAVRLNDRIHYAGRLSGNELVENYYAADVLILPSYAEPWGLVVNEAMAVGLPVIVSDRVGCIDDLVIHKKTGLITKAGCQIELHQAIEYMMTNSQERIAMANQAAKMISHWTLENEAKIMHQAWNTLVCA